MSLYDASLRDGQKDELLSRRTPTEPSLHLGLLVFLHYSNSDSQKQKSNKNAGKLSLLFYISPNLRLPLFIDFGPTNLPLLLLFFLRRCDSSTE